MKTLNLLKNKQRELQSYLSKTIKKYEKDDIDISTIFYHLSHCEFDQEYDYFISEELSLDESKISSLVFVIEQDEIFFLENGAYKKSFKFSPKNILSLNKYFYQVFGI